MKIHPNYRHNHVCHYCKKNNANEKLQHEETWYGVVKSHSIPLSVEYMKIKVSIPRCEECYNKHRAESLPLGICFLILFGISLFLIFSDFSTNFGKYENAEMVLAIFVALLLGFIISALVSVIIGKLLEYVIHSFFHSTDFKKEGDTRDYDPIRKLIGCGFNFTKPDAAKGKAYRKIDPAKFNDTIKSIIEKNDCIVEE